MWVSKSTAGAKTFAISTYFIFALPTTLQIKMLLRNRIQRKKFRLFLTFHSREVLFVIAKKEVY
jgi:hypothetical protein